MSRRVLVVAAHPDDEVLGCGATVSRHAALGDEVQALILAEGATSRDASRDAVGRREELESLRSAAERAAEALGAAAPRFAGLPDNRMDGIDLLDVVKAVEGVIADVQPAIVYTHHVADLNVDHRLTHRAVLTACRALPGACVRAIYAFETVSSTEWGSAGDGGPFRPTRFHDVSDHLRRKLEALGHYGAELRPFPHARSIEAVEALARVRGASVGVVAAEAFEVVRELA